MEMKAADHPKPAENRDHLASSEHFQDLLTGNQFRNVLLTLLVIFAAGILVVQARQILIPITLACFLSAILSPVVFMAKRYRIPRAVSAACLIIALMSIFVGVAVAVSDPAGRWVKELPERLETIRHRLPDWRSSLEGLTGLGDSLQQLTSTEEEPAREAIAIEVSEESWLEALLTRDIPIVLTSALIVIVLTYFLLISQGKIARSVARLPQSYTMRRQLIATIRDIKTDLSIYLMTITVINCLLGVVVTAALYLLGMPNPIFWGLLAGLFNFAPYVGVLAYVCLLFLGCISTLASLEATLTICGVYLFINALEGNFLTPTAIGKRLALSPVSVFVSVIIWTWLWGAAGALMAAPILACLKIVLGNISRAVYSRRAPIPL